MSKRVKWKSESFEAFGSALHANNIKYNSLLFIVLRTRTMCSHEKVICIDDGDGGGGGGGKVLATIALK